MSVTSKQKLLAKLRIKSYRDAYVAEHVKTSVPIQLRILRDQHDLTQAELARRARTTQTVISRIEDPDYGNLSLNSLLKIAAGLDVALLVKFVPFSRLLEEFKDVSPEAVAAESFDKEIDKLEQWATGEPLIMVAEGASTVSLEGSQQVKGTRFSFTVDLESMTFSEAVIEPSEDYPSIPVRAGVEGLPAPQIDPSFIPQVEASTNYVN
jgi:transcriptional regulator with XRE-family HTH domain